MNAPLRILHLEDDPVTSELVSGLLRRDGLAVDMDRVDTLADFGSRLSSGSHALILSDFSIPGMNALEALHLAHERRPNLPYVFFSGTLGEEAAIEALKQGATDYVLKDRPGRLVPAVRRALREREERSRQAEAEHAGRLLAAIVSSSENAIFSKTLEGRITSWNVSAERLFGYGAAEAIGQPITLIVPPDRFAEELSILEGVKHGQGIENQETYRRHKDGSLTPVSISVSPVRDREGKIIGASSIARDMTERKKGEEALRQSEEKFRAVFEQAAIGMGRVNFTDARWIDVNDAFCRMLGYSRQEICAAPWPQITHAEDVELDLIPFQRMAKGELQQYTVEKRFIHKQGHPIWARLTLSLVRDRQGRPDYEVAIVEDITERKETEAALQKARQELAVANRDLDRKVREHTAKLRETVAELEGFSYSLVHDMRAPLRAIHTYASVLEEDSRARLLPESLDHLRRIKLAAHRMDQLIIDALNYSKLVRDELPLRSVNLGPLLRGIIETYPNLQPPGAEIRLQIEDLHVNGNEAALTQVFSNLLGNAVKFVAPGTKPKVRIWAEELESESVLIWVEDNGIGIPKEGQGKIFGMFQRMHRAEAYPGTGIGLAIVRKALERIGGQVCLDSEPGKGSRFCVKLERAIESKQPDRLR